jgi:hypothetical protein
MGHRKRRQGPALTMRTAGAHPTLFRSRFAFRLERGHSCPHRARTLHRSGRECPRSEQSEKRPNCCEARAAGLDTDWASSDVRRRVALAKGWPARCDKRRKGGGSERKSRSHPGCPGPTGRESQRPGMSVPGCKRAPSVGVGVAVARAVWDTLRDQSCSPARRVVDTPSCVAARDFRQVPGFEPACHRRHLRHGLP